MPRAAVYGPCPLSHFASLPARVVLPEPCRPASMITVGGFLANASWRVSPPRMPTSSSLTILTTCWAGLSAAGDLGALGAVLDAGDELAHHGQRDVGFQQRQPDLAGGGVDVGVGQPALAAQPLQRTGQPVGQRFKHAVQPNWLRIPASRARGQAARRRGHARARRVSNRWSKPALRPNRRLRRR